MAEGSRLATEVTMAMAMLVQPEGQQASIDSGVAMGASIDMVQTGQGSTGRVGKVFHPIPHVQPSLMSGTIRVFRDRQPSNICWEP